MGRPPKKVFKIQSASESASESGRDKKPTTKAAMVRAALAEGIEKPGPGVEFIKAMYGIDLSRPMWSSYRAQINAREARRAGLPPLPRGRRPKSAVEGYLAPPRNTSKGGGDLLDAMETMKPLVASLGVEKVKRLAELLG